MSTLAERAGALSAELWRVNSRVDAVRWCASVDSILLDVVRLFDALNDLTTFTPSPHGMARGGEYVLLEDVHSVLKTTGATP